MDGMGNFAGQLDDDAGIETPLNIGNDERRMHVRAYNYWVSLLDGRAYPSIEDLEPETLEDFGPNSVLLDFTGGIENPSVAWLGHKLREACELPEDIDTIQQIPSRSLLSRLTDHYMQIIANRAPIGFEAEFTADSGREIMYRGILMPFSSDDDTIDFIYGVINWKEAAEPELSQSITDEIDRALSAIPVPHAAVTAPAWADGPHAAEAELEEPFDLGDFALEGDAAEADAPSFVPSADDSLADWLAAARTSAEDAGHADVRSRVALYRALGQAYDFALNAETRADEYTEMLTDAGLVVQGRAPMTPVVKLVFGVGYDKTRLAEYALVLTHGKRHQVECGAMQAFVEAYAGGLKGIVQAERALKRDDLPKAAVVRAVEKARQMMPRGIVELAGDDEFVVLVARRVDGDHVAVLGQVTADDRAVERALRQMIR